MVKLQEGEYFIRCLLDSFSTLYYISGPPNVNLQIVSPQPSIHAKVRSINRDTRTQRIRERDLLPECFVEVIHRKNGTILLRQIATKRYATVYQNQTSSSIDGNAPMISFIKFSDDPTRGPVDASEFKLVAPTGNEADGVAILSMSTECYVEIGDVIYFLHPVCKFENISDNGLFRFELRFGCF